MNSWGHHLLVMFPSSSLWDRELLLTSILSSVYWITSIAFRFNIVGQVTRQFSEAPFLPSIFSINGLTIPSFLLQWAGTASIDFSLAQLIQVIVLLSTGGNNGGGTWHPNMLSSPSMPWFCWAMPSSTASLSLGYLSLGSLLPFGIC